MTPATTKGMNDLDRWPWNSRSHVNSRKCLGKLQGDCPGVL